MIFDSHAGVQTTASGKDCMKREVMMPPKHGIWAWVMTTLVVANLIVCASIHNKYSEEPASVDHLTKPAVSQPIRSFCKEINGIGRWVDTNGQLVGQDSGIEATCDPPVKSLGP